MKLCWDNINDLRFSIKTGNWFRSNHTYYYHESCPVCEEAFLAEKYKREGLVFCSRSCAAKYFMSGRKNEKSNAYGHRLKGETKKKISDKIRRIWGNDHQRKKLILKMTGRKVTLKTRQKMSKSQRGKKLTGVHKRKLSIARKGKYCGPEASNWRGGIAYLPYCSVWTDTLKKNIKERDGWECQNPLCETPNVILCVHHINYDKIDCEVENLITLCNTCNSKANKDRRWHEAYYTAIMDKNKQQRIIKTRRAYHE